MTRLEAQNPHVTRGSGRQCQPFVDALSAAESHVNGKITVVRTVFQFGEQAPCGARPSLHIHVILVIQREVIEFRGKWVRIKAGPRVGAPS